jgi:hypothetical protein
MKTRNKPLRAEILSGVQIVECYCMLQKAELNIVGEVLKEQARVLW